MRASGDLGDRPVVVLTATHHDLGLPEPYEERSEVAWLELQTELASLSTAGRQQTVAGAGHYIHVERPEVVADAVAETAAAAGRSAAFAH